MNIIRKFIYILLFIFSSTLIITKASSQEDYRYRYKDNGIILGEKIIIPNEAPIINDQTIPNGSSGIEYSYKITANDPDGDVLNWSLSGNIPSGLNINSETGEIYGQLDISDGGNFSFTASVSDGIDKSNALISMSIAGCNTGEIGSVCTDNFFYAGVLSGQRFYIDKGHPSQKNKWDAANSYCSNLEIGSNSNYYLTGYTYINVFKQNIPDFFNEAENTSDWYFWTSYKGGNGKVTYYDAYQNNFFEDYPNYRDYNFFCYRR